MKKSVLIIVNIVLVVVLFGILGVQSAAKTDLAKGFDGNSIYSGFLDNSGLAENPKELTELIKKTSEELQMNIFIYVAGASDSYRSDYDIEVFADDFYDEIYGEDTDGAFYYMDLSGHSPAYDYISTSGKAVIMYQKNIDNIFARIDNYLPPSGQTVYPENVENAVKCFLSALENYSTYKPSALEYYHDESSGKYMFMKNGEFVVSKHKPMIYNIILLSACMVFGLLVAVIFYFITKSRYKFKKSQNSAVYVQNDKTVFHRSTDTFIRTYTTKHKIETSSGGGRSGGGGGHSHSGGHGGGGHHR